MDIPLKINNKVYDYMAGLSQARIDSYSLYWDSIRPVSHMDYWQRWLFAIISVNLSWQANVRAYNLLKDKAHKCSFKTLFKTLQKSKAGLYKVKSRAIFEFREKFFANPQRYYPDLNNLQKFRDAVAKDSYGLKLTKTSFALELMYPLHADVVCLDRHIARIYGVNNPTRPQYRAMEAHWLDACHSFNIPSPIARHCYWDDFQQQPDTTYWSYVFEEEKTNALATLSHARI